MLTHIIRSVLCSIALLVFTPAIIAETVETPQIPPILTVSGEAIGDDIVYDRAALMALTPTTIETSTIWTDGVHSFVGVSLFDLVHELGVEDSKAITAKAVNDYAVDIPMDDIVEGGPILAYLMNGEEMPLREKGPLWIVYPYDSNANYRSEMTYARSVWQLDQIEIVE